MIKFEMKVNGQTVNMGNSGIQMNGSQYKMRENGDGTVTMEQVDPNVDEQEGIWIDSAEPKKELGE